MNRLKLITVALACALALGACVDDKESASVENLRNAKAKQLEALAAFSNAQAESTKLLAEAEAALKMARAEAQRLLNELKGIELEIAKAGLQSKLEIQKLTLEAELENAKAALLRAKAALIAAQDGITLAEMQRIQTLIAKADEALTALNEYKLDLLTLKTSLIEAEFDLKTAEAAKEGLIATNQRTIATQNILLAEYAKYNKVDKAAAEKLANEAEATQKALSDKSNLVAAKHNDSKKNMLASNSALDGTKLGQAAYYARELSNCVETEQLKAFKKEFTYSDGYNGSASSATGYEFVENGGTYFTPFYFYTVDTDMLSADVITQERKVVVAKSQKAEAEKALTVKKTEQGYKDALKAVTDAQEEFNKAETSAKQEEARQKIQNAEQNLKNYTAMEETNLSRAGERLTDAEAKLTRIKDLQTALTSEENVKAYDAAKKALEDAIVVELDSRIAKNTASFDASMQQTLAANLRALAAGYADVDALIATAKDKIITAEKAIETYSGVKTQEQLIALYNIEIAQCEQNIIKYEAIYKTYKDQLDAIITGK